MWTQLWFQPHILILPLNWTLEIRLLTYLLTYLLQCTYVIMNRATVEYHADMPAEHLPPVHVDIANNDVDFIIRLFIYLLA